MNYKRLHNIDVFASLIEKDKDISNDTKLQRIFGYNAFLKQRLSYTMLVGNVFEKTHFKNELNAIMLPEQILFGDKICFIEHREIARFTQFGRSEFNYHTIGELANLDDILMISQDYVESFITNYKIKP